MQIGVQAAFSRLGVIIALVFVGLPFVVRTVQPVLEDIDLDQEEAAATLGATRLQTFRRVTLPALWPAVITGATLASPAPSASTGRWSSSPATCP